MIQRFEDMRDFPAYLVRRGMAASHRIAGCIRSEVDAIRRVQRVIELPDQYESFLRLAGRRAGDLLRGTDIFFPAPADPEFVAAAHELLAENRVAHLMDPGSVVMGMHQGYQVYWIDSAGAVCSYVEADGSLAATWPSMVAFLRQQIDDHAAIRDRIDRLERR